jgi:hypothetical protein
VVAVVGSCKAARIARAVRIQQEIRVRRATAAVPLDRVKAAAVRLAQRVADALGDVQVEGSTRRRG